MQDFQLASGSTLGQDHVDTGKNNQDAYACTITDDAVIAVACDGCGSGDHSEVGAQIGAQIIVSEIGRSLIRLNEDNISPTFWDDVRMNVLGEIERLTRFMGVSFSQTIQHYFLFTVIGALITRRSTHVFSIGDGIYFLNGNMHRLGPFPNNEPPYMSYALTGSCLVEESPHLLHFQIQEEHPTEDVVSLLLGTDGVEELLQASDRTLPGRTEPAGPIQQFWEKDRYFTNPFNVGRRLNLINPRVPRTRLTQGAFVHEHGLLRDDTTFVVIRRKPGA